MKGEGVLGKEVEGVEGEGDDGEVVVRGGGERMKVVEVVKGSIKERGVGVWGWDEEWGSGDMRMNVVDKEIMGWFGVMVVGRVGGELVVGLVVRFEIVGMGVWDMVDDIGNGVMERGFRWGGRGKERGRKGRLME